MFHKSDLSVPELELDLEENSSRNEYWWQFAEPIWTTATRQGQKVYMSYFSRCEVPYKGILPEECTGYPKSHIIPLKTRLNQAFIRLQNGYSLAMVMQFTNVFT